MWLWSQRCSGWQTLQLCKKTRRCNQSIGYRRNRRKLSDNKLSTIFLPNNSIRKFYYFLLLFMYGIFSKSIIIVNGFCMGLGRSANNVVVCSSSCRRSIMKWKATNDSSSSSEYIMDDDNNGDERNQDIQDNFDLELDEINEFPSPIPDLSWRVEKMRLEEANTRRFLKAGPRFLPYDECRRWVQAWNRWDSKDDWVSWIDEGEKRNSYIPARPAEYYGRLGQWRGWDHFLGKVGDDEGDYESDFQ